MWRWTIQIWRATRCRVRRLCKTLLHRLRLATRGQVAELQQSLWAQTGAMAELKMELQALSQRVQRLDGPDEGYARLAALQERIGHEEAARAGAFSDLQNNLQTLVQTVHRLDGPDEGGVCLAALEHRIGREEAARKGELDALKSRLQTLDSVAHRLGEVEAASARDRDESSMRLAAVNEHLIAAEAALAGALAALNEKLQTLTETVQRVPALEVRLVQIEQLGQQQTLALTNVAGQARSATDLLQALRERLAQTVNWLSDQPWRVSPAPADETLISVIMAARDRADCVAAAIESVQRQSYSHWELLVIDDGSSDDTAARAEAIAAVDGRVRCLRTPPRGVSAARNRGLEAACGTVIAYLDTDNVMAPDYLREVAAAFTAHPNAEAVYAAQVIQPAEGTGSRWVRYQHFDRAALERENYIDLNVFAHRRGLVESAGGFDEALTRLVDYDMILRYTERQPPLPLAALGGTYNDDKRSDRISLREGLGLSTHALRRRHERPLPSGLRVLYAVWHWPQVTESYVRWEAEYMRRRGVEVLFCPEVHEVACWFENDFAVTNEPLERAIAHFRPHLIHAHWLGQGQQFGSLATRLGVPLTVRGHGFELSQEVVRTLQAEPSIRSIYLHPHWPPQFADQSKLQAVATGFAPHLYYPSPKERRRVFRTAAALASKELKLFIDVAAACPEFEFVMAVAPALRHEAYLGELVEYNRARNSPVRLLIGLPHEQTAEWMRTAGIYLHTMAPQSKVGGPMSLAEAMATGAYVIARRLDPLVEMIGSVGGYYNTVAEAAERLRETLRWPAARWTDVERYSVDRAYLRHGETMTFGAILDDWLAITGYGLAERPASALNRRVA